MEWITYLWLLMYFQNMYGQTDEIKTVHSLLEAFYSVLSEGRKPEKLRTNKCAEFLNESFQQYLKMKYIQFCTANNEPKASVVD